MLRFSKSSFTVLTFLCACRL